MYCHMLLKKGSTQAFILFFLKVRTVEPGDQVPCKAALHKSHSLPFNNLLLFETNKLFLIVISHTSSKNYTSAPLLSFCRAWALMANTTKSLLHIPQGTSVNFSFLSESITFFGDSWIFTRNLETKKKKIQIPVFIATSAEIGSATCLRLNPRKPLFGQRWLETFGIVLTQQFCS